MLGIQLCAVLIEVHRLCICSYDRNVRDELSFHPDEKVVTVRAGFGDKSVSKVLFNFFFST